VDRCGAARPDRDRRHRCSNDRAQNRAPASFIIRASILIGIVFLMTVKPPLAGALIAMATAAGAGMLAAVPRFGRPTSHRSMVSA
jgi:hypothetical protein